MESSKYKIISHYSKLSIDDLILEFNTSFEGLSEKDAELRLKQYGKNTLEVKKHNIIIDLLKEQFSSPFILLLLLASILSFIIKDYLEGLVILITIFIYIIFDFFQRYKSEKILETLKENLEEEVTVIRDGIIKKIKSEYLVPGDLIILKRGEKVPADIRIIEATNLYVDESLLTGESKPVYKAFEPLNKEPSSISDFKNILFKGSTIIRGYCKGIVIATGKNTVFGYLFSLVDDKSVKKTNLDKEISKFGRYVSLITIAIIIISLIILILNRSLSLIDAILFSIALGVAVIPESLPTVLTTILTYSLGKIYKKGAIVKRLSSVQTLGSVDIIFTDKTGTLTMNQMTVRKIFYNGSIFKVTGFGYSISGEILKKENNKYHLLKDTKDLKLLSECIVNCNLSSLSKQGNEWIVIGDPLEGALLILARKLKYYTLYPKLKIIDFDNVRKMMSVIVKKDDKYILYSKGAPEKILEKSSKIYVNNKIEDISKYKDTIKKIIDYWANKGYKLLAIAYKEIDKYSISLPSDEIEKDFIFLGILALEDPLRQDVKEAISFAKEAGIDVYIITGDHPNTAEAIARRIGIYSKAILSKELKNKSKEDIYNILKKYKIIARADPEDKLKILEVFKEKNKVVAMTGDGINDILALKRADIGISFKSATDAAKEAADMILINNGFTAIIEAIKEGRRIMYILKLILERTTAMNLTLMYNILVTFYGYGIVIFKAIQILYYNIIIETLNGISLSNSDVEKKILLEKPYKKIINKNFIFEILKFAIILGTFSIFLLILLLRYNIDKDLIASIEILYFALAQYTIILYFVKTQNIELFNNKIFWGCVTLTLIILYIFLFTDFAKYLEFQKIPIKYLFLVLGFVISTFITLYAFYIVETLYLKKIKE